MYVCMYALTLAATRPNSPRLFSFEKENLLNAKQSKETNCFLVCFIG